MTEWRPEVVLIEKLERHPDADLLSIATVLNDYPIVVKTDDYKVGDKVGYVPIDSIVPDIQDYYFLCPKAYEKYEEDGEIKQRQIGFKYNVGSVPEKYRIIKSKKIRMVYSQGMLVKIPQELNIGDSITDLIGLKKCEEENEDNIPNAKKSRGSNGASPPQGWNIPYYDIEGLRKYINCLQEDEEIILTEKLNGSNAGFCYDGEKLWSKSRNFYKKDDPDDMWVDIAIRYNLAEKLAKYSHMVAFGEIYSQVKKFRYDGELVNGAMPAKIRFFDIYNTKIQRYIDYDDFLAITKDLDLPIVPELYRGKWLGKELMYQYAEGPTTLGGKHVREGFCLRTVKERFEPRLNGRMQCKLIGEGYNLSK